MTSSQRPKEERDPRDMSPEDDFLFYLRRGAELLHRGQNQEARVALERAVDLRADNSKARNLLGLAYFKLGLLELAREVYESLVEAHAHEPPLHVNLGLVLLRQGRLEEAERTLRTALMMAPDHTRAHCYLGMVLYRRGDLAGAREHFIRGDAVDFARRLESKMGAEKRSSWEAIRDVAEEGVQSLSGESIAFTAVTNDERYVRDEAAWETTVGHQGAPKTGEFEIPSFIGAAVPQGLESMRPTAAAPSVPAKPKAERPSHDVPWRDSPMRQDPRGDGDLHTLALDPMDPPQDQERRRSLTPVPTPDPISTLHRNSTAPRTSRAPKPVDPSLPPVPFVEPSLRLFGDLSWAPGFSAGRELGPQARLVLSGTAYLRASAIVAAVGEVGYFPVARMEAGRATASSFGGASDPIYRLVGDSKLLLRVWNHAIAMRDVRGLVVLESALVGFEGDFSWDARRSHGLDVVRLDGRGSVLINADGPPVLASLSDEAMVVGSEALLAWTDGLHAESGPNPGATDWLTLRGTGLVLVSTPEPASLSVLSPRS